MKELATACISRCVIKLMANENMDAWGTSPRVVNATILAAKEFLDGLIKKYNNLKHLQAQHDIFITLIVTEHSFTQCQKGVGRAVIKQFLGKNWSDPVIEEALAVLHDDEVDREAYEKFEKQSQAKSFRQAVLRF